MLRLSEDRAGMEACPYWNSQSRPFRSPLDAPFATHCGMVIRPSGNPCIQASKHKHIHRDGSLGHRVTSLHCTVIKIFDPSAMRCLHCPDTCRWHLNRSPSDSTFTASQLLRSVANKNKKPLPNVSGEVALCSLMLISVHSASPSL